MDSTISKIIVNFMKSLGIKFCFGIPGSNAPILYELEREKSIKLILTKHENNAVFMATGVTKSTGKTAACFGSQGPGALNMVEGVAAAYHDSQPLLILIGQVPPSLYGKNAFQETSGKGYTVNQFGVFRNITKFSAKITNKNKKDFLNILKKAYYNLTSGRPGPVCLEIASDIGNQKIEVPSLNFIPKKEKLALSKINLSKIKKVIETLRISKKIAILCGCGALNSPPLIKKISKTLSIPVITTLKGKGVIPENDSLCFGCVGLCGSKKANELINSGLETLLVIGTSLSQFTTNNYSLDLKDTRIIRIDINKYKKIASNEIFIKCGAEEVLRIIEKSLQKIINKEIISERKQWLKKFEKYKEEKIREYRNGKLTPQFFVSQIRKLIPKDAIICTESVEWTEKYLPIFSPHTHIVCTGLAPIGCSLAEAIGCKLANPNKIVISIQGDGGFNMSFIELMTATNYKAPIIAIVLNNGVLGPIFNSQIQKYGRSFFSTFDNTKFKDLALSCGFTYFLIKNKKDIKEKIPQIIYLNKKGKPVLVEVKINSYEKWP